MVHANLGDMQTLEGVDVCHICSAHSSLTFVALCYPLLQLWRFARILICAKPAAQLRGYFFVLIVFCLGCVPLIGGLVIIICACVLL